MDPIPGVEGGGVGLQLVGTGRRLTVAMVVGDHAATDLGDSAIGVAEYWPTLKAHDGDEEKTRQVHRRHEGRSAAEKKL